MSARTNRGRQTRGPPGARRTPSARSRPSPRRPLPPPHNPQQRQPAPRQRSRNRDHQCRDRRHPGRRRLPQGPDHHPTAATTPLRHQRHTSYPAAPTTRRHRRDAYKHAYIRNQPPTLPDKPHTTRPTAGPRSAKTAIPHLAAAVDGLRPHPYPRSTLERQPVHPLRHHLQHTAVAERRQPPHHHRRQKQTRAESRALPAGQRPRARLLRHHRRPRPPRPGRTVHQRKRQPHRPTKTAGRTTSTCGSRPTSDPPSPRRAATRMLPCSLWVAWSVLSRVK
ncbi:hypothetical protein SUDANB54_00022 [Streptomyces sp. enrichment culture]